jgi:hypothetical protein
MRVKTATIFLNTRTTVSKKNLLLFYEMELPTHFMIIVQLKMQDMKAQVSLICSLFLFLSAIVLGSKKEISKCKIPLIAIPFCNTH